MNPRTTNGTEGVISADTAFAILDAGGDVRKDFVRGDEEVTVEECYMLDGGGVGPVQYTFKTEDGVVFSGRYVPNRVPDTAHREVREECL